MIPPLTKRTIRSSAVLNLTGVDATGACEGTSRPQGRNAISRTVNGAFCERMVSSVIGSDEQVIPVRGQDWFDNGQHLETHLRPNPARGNAITVTVTLGRVSETSLGDSRAGRRDADGGLRSVHLKVVA